MTYPIIGIPDDAPELPEQQGTKTKYWIHLEKKHLLFKIGRENTGENWAEIVACALCELLGLPHAHYDFAIWKNCHKGVITESICPRDSRLVMGNELLSNIHKSYPKETKYKVQDHTIGRIFTLLNDPAIQLPIAWEAPDPAIKSAIDVFLGYLLLDAWIANQDRHHENWGVIHLDQKIYLAPTYDHAASMGQNESDEKRKRLLETRDQTGNINHYVTKARSAIYRKKSEKKQMLTLEAFHSLGRERPKAMQFWLQKLGDISIEECHTVFMDIPKTEISDIAIEFSIKLLELNKDRLLKVTP